MAQNSSPWAEEILEVAIIGAGFSGLGMGIRLKEEGVTNFLIFDKGDDVGGTWRDNVYPGCGCDIKSQLYSYSFEPYPDWSNAYASQGEIFDYIKHCARKYAMYPFIRFNSTVEGATFDEESGLWRLSIAGQASVLARNVVAAPGPFAAPADPHIPGQQDFAGAIMHTAQWDDSIDLAGKRVALIGTGATAVQVGPAIADRVAHLSVFQRTPNWILPRLDRQIGDREKRLNRRLPILMKARRLGMYWFNELTAPFLILRYGLFKSQPERIARMYLQRKVPDPVLREKLTPKYKFGCKRVLVSSAWYTTLQRDDVSLVDAGIERITANGIRTVDGVEHDFDVIILATGFQVRNTGAPFGIYGNDGQSLADKWRDGAEAYKGVSTSGFPNLYFLVGPFTGPGHTSVIAYAEAQIAYACQAIKLRARHGLKAVSVKDKAERRFVAMMDRRSKHTVWTSGGCKSWYLSPNGRNNTLYPGFNFVYRLSIRRFNQRHYDLVKAPTKQVGLG